jgi:NarL family two-component system response regulator YdfI
VEAVPLNGNGSGLTVRELEVLDALARGARNTEIASGLGIAERTVKAHLANIYQKLGVESRGAAVAAARSRGIL